MQSSKKENPLIFCSHTLLEKCELVHAWPPKEKLARVEKPARVKLLFLALPIQYFCLYNPTSQKIFVTLAIESYPLLFATKDSQQIHLSP